MIGIIITITLFCLVGIWCIGYDTEDDTWEADQYPDWLRDMLQEGCDPTEDSL